MGEANVRRLRISTEAERSGETRIPLSDKSFIKLVEAEAFMNGTAAAASAAMQVAQGARQKYLDEMTSISDAHGFDTGDGKWAASHDRKTRELVLKPEPKGKLPPSVARRAAERAAEGAG